MDLSYSQQQMTSKSGYEKKLDAFTQYYHDDEAIFRFVNGHCHPGRSLPSLTKQQLENT